jgi:hypothetical protein
MIHFIVMVLVYPLTKPFHTAVEELGMYEPFLKNPKRGTSEKGCTQISGFTTKYHLMGL